MHDPLVIGVKEFLKKHQTSGPLLLGFSGGGDSLALLHLLLACGYKGQLHLAHVDHGWREESRVEAEALAEMAKQLGLPFHLHRLEKVGESNLESEARGARLRFFSTLYHEIGCEALLLAHHADDQAETVLKRVLEGAHLLALGGIRESTQYEDMRILRPLLGFSKLLIHRWLRERGLKGFEDSTNHDPAFLRARLRTQLLPFLAENFGKEVSSNLVRLGKRFEEVEMMIQGEVEKNLATGVRGPLGLMLEIPAIYPRIVRNAIVKQLVQGEDFFLSHESLEAVCALLESGAANRQFRSRGKTLVVDRGILFLLERAHTRFSSSRTLEAASWVEGGYQWEVTISSGQSAQHSTSWRELWQGEGRVLLPKGEYQLLAHDAPYSFPGGVKIKKWWGEHRVPAFLRPMFPLIIEDGRVVRDFLTGKKLEDLHSNNLMAISLKFKLINN